jgi:hypothetical protein
LPHARSEPGSLASPRGKVAQALRRCLALVLRLFISSVQKLPNRPKLRRAACRWSEWPDPLQQIRAQRRSIPHAEA